MSKGRELARAAWLGITCAALIVGLAPMVAAQSGPPEWRGPTNGRKPPRPADGQRPSKEWFRVVENPRYLPDRLYVRLSDPEKGRGRAAEAAHRRAGMLRILWVSQSVPGLVLVEVPHGRVLEAIQRYLDDVAVAYAEPMYVQESLVGPNDTRYEELWGLDDVWAPEAWDAWTGDPDFPVVVADSGFQLDHPDLVPNLWSNPNEILGDANGDGCPGVCGLDDDGDGLIDEDRLGRVPGQPGYEGAAASDDDENGYYDDTRGWDFGGTGLGGDNDPSPCVEPPSGNDPATTDPHGSHVAGTVAARGNNGIGVTGVSWHAKIVPVKLVDDSCSFVGGLVQALDYAVKVGARVSNHSYGRSNLSCTPSTDTSPCTTKGTVDAGCTVVDAYSQAEADALAAAANRDHLAVMAAGNCGFDLDGPSPIAGSSSFVDVDFYPADLAASHENAISVGAQEQFFKGRATFSNYGTTSVDLFAPGTEILSTVPDSSYGYSQGTSMASPMVAGAAALILSRFPYLHAWQLPIRLRGSVKYMTELAGTSRADGALWLDPALATWVDPGCGASCGFGSYTSPFESFTEALGPSSALPPHGHVVFLGGGSDPWTGAIIQPMVLDAEGGTFVLGQ